MSRKGKILRRIRLENSRVGYQVAVDLWGILLDTSWARFNAMLVANSIILGMIGLILTSEKGGPLYPLAIFLCIPGFLLSFLWLILMQRDFKFSSFYAAFARELEKNCLDPVRTVSNGESFAKTYDVVVDGEHFQLEGYEQTQTRRVIKWTVYVFMFMYGFIVLYAIIWLLLGDSIKAYFNIK